MDPPVTRAMEVRLARVVRTECRIQTSNRMRAQPVTVHTPWSLRLLCQLI